MRVTRSRRSSGRGRRARWARRSACRAGPAGARRAVHEPHEGLDAARHVDREGHGGVVGGSQQHPVQEVADRELLPCMQPEDRRGAVVGLREHRVGGDRDDVVELRALQHQQRRHHLREARDRPPAVGRPWRTGPGRRRGRRGPPRGAVSRAASGRPPAWAGPRGTARATRWVGRAWAAAPWTPTTSAGIARREGDGERDQDRARGGPRGRERLTRCGGGPAAWCGAAPA